jgi:cephalosporin-C deacetylase
MTAIDAWDVTFPGFGGEPIKAWYRRPAGVAADLPVVVHFQGYGGGRGHLLENLSWAAGGFAHLMMDSRGQGSSWSEGETPDPHGSAPAAPGVMTRGLEAKESYYYRRLITDAALAVDAAAALPGVDATRIGVVGASQGGALATAATALNSLVKAAAIRVPFLSDMRHATEVTNTEPYQELTRYLAVHRGAVDHVFNLLAYFDSVNFARHATAPATFTVGLADDITPPSTVYAAYNNYAGDKRITVHPFNGHESGGPVDDAEAQAFFRQRL